MYFQKVLKLNPCHVVQPCYYDIINALKSVPDLSTTAVAAVTARLVVLDSITLAETAEVMMECGMSLEQALAVRQAVDGFKVACSVPAAARPVHLWLLQLLARLCRYLHDIRQYLW